MYTRIHILRVAHMEYLYRIARHLLHLCRMRAGHIGHIVVYECIIDNGSIPYYPAVAARAIPVVVVVA